mgnify:CR=1 FL=1
MALDLNWRIETRRTPKGTTIRIYHMGDNLLADRDIEVLDTVLPELYAWLEHRMAFEEAGGQG